MKTYESLSETERAAVECALDELKTCCIDAGFTLANDDRAARAAEALARYIVESRD